MNGVIRLDYDFSGYSARRGLFVVNAALGHHSISLYLLLALLRSAHRIIRRYET